DIGVKIVDSGNLEHWAKQGVLLLNATLTVRAGEAGSHQKLGWEKFTDTVIETLSKKQNKLVFMLWGRYAKEKGRNIDVTKHLVLEAAHPSPLSAYNGFFGCKHFSQCNAYLIKNNQKPIKW
ncbi:uracil-DNA glycosylase, partial [Candidatus Kaiserbacteria bacterium]|nr:uracil-DNA glycosylase [Candidatus Kaiserbacteria bacterium]